MRYGLLLILLLLTLTACGVADPRPGELLYVSTFNAYNADWQQFEGLLEAQIVGGGQNPTMQLTVDNPNTGTFTIMEQREFSDFDLIVNAAQVSGPDDNGFGIVFRHRDNDNFYTFMISGDGYYRVQRRVEGSDLDGVLSDWKATPLIHQGQAANSIRVIGQGDTFTFLINDAQVPLCAQWNPVEPETCLDAEVAMQLVDDTFSQGRIGLAARSFNQGAVVVAFDNMLICGPKDSPPVPYICAEEPLVVEP